MIQDIHKDFDNQYKDVKPGQEDVVFVFRGFHPKIEILASDLNGIDFPKVKELSFENEEYRYLFRIENTNYFLLTKDIEEFNEYHYTSTRILRSCNPIDLCFAGMSAIHLYTWYQNNHHCGRCGNPLIHHKTLRALKCTHCDNLIFPTISPCIIAGVRNKDSICVTHYGDREYKGRALIAGYIEVGETPEQAVKREVMEEVGLKVKNIEYYGSQPWGFDGNLLLGYFCDLDGDDTITLDQNELAKARFIKRDELYENDNLLALTGTMIDEFRKGSELPLN